MKAINFLLTLICGTFAATVPLTSYRDPGTVHQVVLKGQTFDASPSAREGFSLNLSEVRLVQIEGEDPVYMTELEKIQVKATGVKFFDITDTPDLEVLARTRAWVPHSYPPLKLHEEVVKVIDTLSTAGPKEHLEKFSSFRTRYYRSETGRKSQQWLLAKIRQITTENVVSALQSSITVDEFQHSWGQNTIIARINGSSLTDHSIVIVGAHQDSTNLWPFLPAPGADDDGSGSVTILEAYRALLVSGFIPERSVEFHWYSAEEGGLLGSQALARSYAAQGLEVYAMSQYDMTAWVKKGTREEIGVVVDFVDKILTEYNKKLIDTYLSIPFVETKCGYACSDHASWSKAGYPSIFTIESSFENSNHNIHTGNDRIDFSPEFSFDHMLEFSKLAVAFVMELSTL